MTWILETPLPVLVIGIVGTLACVFGWLQTGRSMLWKLAGGIVILTAGLVLLGELVQTDREQIRATLESIAKDVEQNDLEAVLSHVHPSAPEIAGQIRAEMPRYVFRDASVKQNLKVRVDRSATPPTANASFNVVVTAKIREGMMQDSESPVPRFVIVDFKRHGDEWKIADYEHHSPDEGFRKR